MMKKLIVASISLLLVLLFADARQAQAQLTIDVAPHVGFGLRVPNQVGDRGEISIGAQAHLALKTLDRLTIVLNPDIDYYLTEAPDITALQVDGNLLLAFGSIEKFFSPYLGLGVALTSVSGNDPRPLPPASTDPGSGLLEGTDIGLNLVAGALFGAGSPRVFFQGRYTMGKHNLYVDDQDNPSPSSGIGVQGGIMFRLNR